MTDDPGAPAQSIPTDDERRYLTEVAGPCREVVGGRELTATETAMLLDIYRRLHPTTNTDRGTP